MEGPIHAFRGNRASTKVSASLLKAFVSWTFPAAITDRDFDLRHWAIGICIVGFGLILTFLRSEMPVFFGVLLANVFLMAGGTLGLVAPARIFALSMGFMGVAYSVRTWLPP